MSKLVVDSDYIKNKKIIEEAHKSGYTIIDDPPCDDSISYDNMIKFLESYKPVPADDMPRMLITFTKEEWDDLFGEDIK